MSIRRKRFRKQPVAMAMLPFLAVLICTMGSLILLLVILVQNARVEADTIKTRREEEQQQETDDERALREQTEDARWRKEILLEARQENTEKLANARLELSHLEDHIRRLQDQWRELTRQVEDLQRLSGDKQEDTSAAEGELRRLEAAIEQAKRELQEAKRAAADRPRSYAIVPTPRRNGTLRRPIYLECTANGVILQPEGIVLGAQDFLPPLGPGNALDAALRAAREYLAQHGGVDVHGEPYPLMLVRPDGAVAYAAARDALRSWDDEFGYELLDADMQLVYGEPDPALAEEVRRAVEMARRRQELLARSAPTRFRRLRRALAGDGDPGQSLLDVRSGDGDGLGDGSGDDVGAGGPQQGGAQQGGPQQGGPQQGSAEQGVMIAGPANHPGGAGHGPGQNDRRPFGAPGRTGSDEPGYGTFNGGRSGGDRSHGGANAGTNNGGSAGGASSANSNPGSRNRRGADGAATTDGPRYPRQAGQAGGPGGAGSRSGPQTINGGGNGGPLEGTRSMAESRGSNWALRDRAPSRANAYTRPVRVTLTPAELYILPDAHSGRPVQTIKLQGATVEHVETLVEAVQRQIDGWGSAPVRGYWRPVLSVQVAPGAERRFEELRVLLDDSGLEVERKAP